MAASCSSLTCGGIRFDGKTLHADFLFSEVYTYHSFDGLHYSTVYFDYRLLGICAKSRSSKHNLRITPPSLPRNHLTLPVFALICFSKRLAVSVSQKLVYV